MGFTEKLLKRQRAVQSCVCVGLDTDLTNKKFPRRFTSHNSGNSLLEFSKNRVLVTSGFACCFKINAGFFRRWGSQGYMALEQLVLFVQIEYPDIPVILDFKAQDIGNSAAQYAAEAFDQLKADAVTTGPYLGSDSVFEFTKKGFAFVLCRTSNKSAGDFQDLTLTPDLIPRVVFAQVAAKVAAWRNQYPELGLVCGATYPKELAEIAGISGNTPLLIPGIGKQEGALKETLEAAVAEDGKAAGRPFVINSSRGIIFAPDPAEAARKLRDEINALLPEGFYA